MYMSSWPLCSWAHWSITEVAEERDWLKNGSPLSTWLLKSFSAEVSLWSIHSHGTQMSSCFCPFREVYSQTSLSSIFPSWSFPVPDHPTKPRLQPMNRCIITHKAISPSKPSEQLGALLEVPHWEDFPSPLQGCPKRTLVLQLSTSGWCLHIMQNTADFCFLKKKAKRNLVWKGGHWGIAFSSLHHMKGASVLQHILKRPGIFFFFFLGSLS